MNRLLAYGLVVLAAATPWLEVLLVVPAGIVAGLSPVPVVALAAVGNVATVMPLIVAGDRVRGWWLRRGRSRRADDEDGGGDPSRRGRRGRRLLERYGLPGLALLGPLVTGIHLATLVAIGAGASRRRTLVWMTIGVTVWSIVMGIVTVAGLDLFVDPERLPDLFGDLAGVRP